MTFDRRVAPIPTRPLGQSGPIVSCLGLGAMGFSGVYGDARDRESITTIQRAIDLGVTLIDTADIYGDGHNEHLVGRAILGRRDDVVLATKFGGGFNPDGSTGGLGRPEVVRPSLLASLGRLGCDHVDLFYLHRVDRGTPIEETVGAMGRLVDEGLTKWIGLSEASPATIRRAHATFPIAVVQSEYSLLTRDAEAEVLPVLKELGIGFAAYSPLGRGVLSGSLRRPADLPRTDWRATVPRFQGAALDRMIALSDQLAEIARPLGITRSQLALAWLLARPEGVVPLPGTRRLANLNENLAAASTTLADATIAQVDAMFPRGVIPEARYPESSMGRLNL
jgi:aryl-alcohol dehydrogenase-like predicted oxidoreductase